MTAHSPRWNDCVALFGGRFDPPHRGHLQAVQGLFTQPGVGQVWLLPAPSPPHKPAYAPIEDRVQLLGLTFGLVPGAPGAGSLRLDLREVVRAEKEPGQPTYSFDTLQEIRSEVAHPAFVIGSDQLEDLPTWHHFPDVLGLCHWIVLARRPHGEDLARVALRQLEGSGLIRPTSAPATWEIAVPGSRSPRFLALVRTEAPEMSSTRIREEIGRNGVPPEKDLTPEVEQYLKRRRLYGSVAVDLP